MKRKKFIIVLVVILAVVGFVGYKAFASAATYYYTVSEFMAQPDSFDGKDIRISGTVLDGTIERQGTSLKFTMVDGQARLPVSYKGVIPDAFKADAEAVVEGKLGADGVFQANTLLAKCPSKYEPATTPAQ